MSRAGFSLRPCITSALALTCAMLAPSATLSGEVTLRSADGTVNIVGEFVEFVDNSYVVKTGLGDLRVSAARISCIGESCPTFGEVEADVTLVGSDAVGAGVMPLLLEGYATHVGAGATITSTGGDGQLLAELVADDGFGDPMGAYQVSSSSSDAAFAALLENNASIGMSARRILPDEARALRDRGAGNMISPSQEHILAVDTLVVIVHPDNPVNELSVGQLRAIYSGDITNWSQVGGNDAPITLVSWDEQSEKREVFESIVFNDSRVRFPSSTVIVSDNNEMALAVNSDVTAIGFSGFAFQRGAQAVSLITECGMTQTPDSFSARTEEYALQRFLYLYNREDLNTEAARDFIEYAISDEAEDVIVKSGFVSLGVDRRPQALDGERARQLLDPNVDPFEGALMREMLSKMVDYDRLSTTFRFRTGSQRLDPRGELNLARLADYLENQPPGTEVLFVGFTDSVGPFESNRQLSVSRAEQVRLSLQELAGDRLSNISMDIAGYGEIAPAACNISDNDKRINRRVEVWIRSGT